MALVLEASEVLDFDDRVSGYSSAIGPLRVARASRANRLAATRLVCERAYGMTAARSGHARSGHARNLGRSATLTIPPCVALYLGRRSAKAVYTYDPAKIASMRTDGLVGPFMADVFATMRARERVLGTVTLSADAFKRRERVAALIQSAAMNDACAVPDNVLYLAMEYASRFLAAPRPPAFPHSDEAVALACWLMASKFETRLGHPMGDELVLGTKTTTRALFAAERDVCIAVDYQLSVVTPQLFLEWFIITFSVAPAVANFAKQFARRTVRCLGTSHYYPSEVAIAVLEFAATRLAGVADGRALGTCLSRYAGVDEDALCAVACSYGLRAD